MSLLFKKYILKNVQQSKILKKLIIGKSMKLCSRLAPLYAKITFKINKRLRHSKRSNEICNLIEDRELFNLFDPCINYFHFCLFTPGKLTKIGQSRQKHDSPSFSLDDLALVNDSIKSNINFY